MTRLFLVAAVLLVTPAVTLAQQAICDCCGVPYTVPGATWLGTSRIYGGLCPKCFGVCEDCREGAESMRKQYKTFGEVRSTPGLSVEASRQVDDAMRNMRQRWNDLRYSCLAGRGSDIGSLDPDRPEMPPPSRGLDTPETKKRLSDQAKKAQDDFTSFLYEFDDVYGDSPDTRKHGLESLGELSRTAELLNRLANDPPDPDFEKVVTPAITPEPKDDGKPKDIVALRKATVALKNSNAYIDAYITSFERYQAAQKAGKKEAAKRQVEAMGKYSHQAETYARTSVVQFRELERVRLKRIDDHRAQLATKGMKWQDELKAAQDKFRDRWPADMAKAFEDVGVPAKQSDSLRKAILELTPEAMEKKLAERKAALELDNAITAALAARKAKPFAPEPPHLDALLLMEQHAHLLHTELAGRKRELPKDNPFPAPKKNKK